MKEGSVRCWAKWLWKTHRGGKQASSDEGKGRPAGQGVHTRGQQANLSKSTKNATLGRAKQAKRRWSAQLMKAPLASPDTYQTKRERREGETKTETQLELRWQLLDCTMKFNASFLKIRCKDGSRFQDERDDGSLPCTFQWWERSQGNEDDRRFSHN